MRSREEEDLKRRQTGALEDNMRLLEAQNAVLAQLAEILSHPPGEREDRPLPPFRPRRARSSLWQTLVPDSHILETLDRDRGRARIVLCPCGHQTLLQAKGWQGCDGILWHGDTLDPEGCDRWFLIRPVDVYVHRFMPAAQLTAV